MRFVYTRHALERMSMWRNIDKIAVEETVFKPDYVERGRNGALIATKTINHEKVKVVYIQKGELIVVITVMTR